MLVRIAAAFSLAIAYLVLFYAPAQAAKLCGWMVESEAPDDERMLTIYLSSDSEIDFLYKIVGRGIVTEGGNSGSANNSGTFTLHAGQTDSPWKYGQTLVPPGEIDVGIEIHQTPADIFSDAPTPLLAAFNFRRKVPASEKSPPATLAKKQCTVVRVR